MEEDKKRAEQEGMAMQSRKGKVEDLTITINKSPTVNLLAFLINADPRHTHIKQTLDCSLHYAGSCSLFQSLSLFSEIPKDIDVVSKVAEK